MTAAEVLQPAIIYLGAGLASALASRAVRLSPIVGYLVAGVIIGPSGFGLVENNDTAKFLAQLGVVFLLFDIGLHFSVREIRTRRDDMMGLAPLQIILCGLAFAGIGWGLGFSLPIAIIVGASLALSSTAVVARILEDRKQPGCPMGRSATAVLVAQDIVAIFILVFAASLGATPNIVGIDLLFALAMAIVALVVALLAGRFVVRPLFRSLAATDNREALHRRRAVHRSRRQRRDGPHRPVPHSRRFPRRHGDLRYALPPCGADRGEALRRACCSASSS